MRPNLNYYDTIGALLIFSGDDVHAVTMKNDVVRLEIFLL